jgi:hypothetical protein
MNRKRPAPKAATYQTSRDLTQESSISLQDSFWSVAGYIEATHISTLAAVWSRFTAACARTRERPEDPRGMVVATIRIQPYRCRNHPKT